MALKRLRERAIEEKRAEEKQVTSNKTQSSTPTNNRATSRTTTSSAPNSSNKSDTAALIRLRERATQEKAEGNKNKTSTKKHTDYNTETKNAYSSAKNKVNSKTTIKSNLSEKERKARIKEIEAEIKQLNTDLNGIGRAEAYGSNDSLKALKKEKSNKKAELSKELKELKRVGTFSASELKQFEIDDAKAKKAALPTYNPTARVAPSGVEAYKKNVSEHYALDKEIDRLEREKALYDDVAKFGTVANEDNFVGQWKANYRSNELSREADKAMSEYIMNPTEENKQIAYAYDAFAKEYAKNNEKALDDENVKASWLTKSMAGYLPQFKDQIVPELVGGGIGLLAGSAVGAPNVGMSVGAGLGTYSQTYDVMRGSVYRALLAEGVDEEIALKAAEDEALISSLIESGETALSWLLAGGGKAISAISGAAKASVAKGSTNAATKFVADLATKGLNKTATNAAKAVTQPLWKTGLRTVGGIVGNAATEYLEEFTQGAVSEANRERALSGTPVGGKGQLVKGAGKVVSDAVTGKNPEVLAELHGQGMEGFKIGLMFGGSQTITNNIVSHYANAKTVKQQNDVVDTIINDEETLNALIEEGKASGVGTVSEKIATEIETARANGEEVTREQVKKLIASNEVYIQSEEQTAEPDPLEQTAREVVNERNRTRPLHETLEALSRNNEPITAEDAKKATGFGEEGSKLVAELANSEGVTFSQAERAVKIAYLAGFSNVEGANIKFETDTQINAFTAGKKDRAMQDLAAKEAAKSATVYDSGVVQNDNFKKLSKPSQELLSTLAKDHMMSVEVKDSVFTAIVNGKRYEADASHLDGRIEGSMSTEKPLIQWALHEDGHRMEQMATDEWNVLANALYERAERLGRRAELGVSQGMLFDDIKAQHDEAGLNLNTRGYFGEVVMRELETIFSSEEEFNAWRAELDTNAQVKTAWQKFMDFLVELIEDVKRIVANRKLSKEARAEAKAELTELECIKELYAEAYKATRDAVNERAKEKSAETNFDKNLEFKINEEYNGSASHSLKGKKSEQYGVMWTLDKGVLDNNEVSAFYGKISETNNNKYLNYHKAADGQLIYEIGNKLIYTDGDYDYPHISKVIAFNTNDGYWLEYGRESFYGGENYGYQTETIIEIVEAVLGEGVVETTTYDSYEADKRSGKPSGKRKNGTATNRGSQNDVISKNFSLKEKDKEYLQLAKNPEQNETRLSEMVSEAAKRAMPNSKITTDDGKLRVVYHGTNTGDFTVFNPDYIGMSSGDNGFFGMGFYFAYSQGEASYYGAKRVIPAYLNLKNPFNFDKELQTYKGKKAQSGYAPDAVAFMNFADKFPDIAKNITVDILEKDSDSYKSLPLSDFSKAFKDVIDNKKFEYQEVENEYGEKETLVLADPQIHEYEYNGKKHNYKDYGFQKRFWGKPNDLDVAYEYLSNSVYSRIDMYNKTRLILDNNKEFTNALKNMGYDGAIQSELGDEAVAFNSEQIKSADLVTYDDKGNIIPLSERFNTKSDDIRYSLKDSEGKTLTKEQQEYFKDSKVRGENGNLLVVYHGSPAKFTVFNHKYLNTNGNTHGRGFYFTEKRSLAEGYERKSGQLLKGYLNITNPLSEDKVTIKKSDFLKLIKATCNAEAQEYVKDGDYDSVSEALRDTWISNYVNTYDTNMNDAYREVANTIYSANTNDVELIAELTNAGRSDIVLRLTHDILGYDGVIYENEEGHHEFVSLVSEQFKSVDNAKPTSDPDIRFSISSKDRKELLDIIEHLKGEFEITKFAKADQKKLAKMTREVLKAYDSKADYDETFNAIDGLYQYMANGEDGHPAVWEDVYNRAYTIAQDIVKNALVVDDYTYQEYKSLRDYLRRTPMKFDAQHDSVPVSYENFNDFRKQNMGRLKFTKDGMAIDAVYQELAGLYPEFFDAEEQINTADQLEQIINVLDEIQPTEVNPFSRDIKDVSMYLANDLTSRFFDIPQAQPTFADKAERRVVEAHIKGGKKVEAVRQQKDAKIKKLIEAQREKTKKQLDKLRQQRDTKVEKERAKRRDALSKMSEHQKAKVLRARIIRHTSDLSKKLVNPTDNQHIPYELQGAVAKLLECINLESNYTYDAESHSYKKNGDGLPTKRTQAFHELQKVYSDISSSVVVDPDLLGEYGLLSDVISLSDKRIADMTSNELEKVWQTIRAIEATVNTANRLFSEGKFTTILEVAEALKASNEGKISKTEFKGIIGKGKKLATLDMLTPETYLHYLGNAGDSVFRMMRDAQDKHISIMKEVSDFTHKELKDVDVNSLENTIQTVKLGGEEVQLSTAQLMELYVLMKREQAKEHILVGGILPDVTETKGLKKITRTKPIRNISVAEISAATSKLTDEQKKVADKLQKYVSSVLSAYGNEASMQVYNYEKFTEKNYWTIRTNKQEIKSDIDKDTAVTTVANKGMTKATKPHANTSVRIGSIFDTFASHSSDMATYAAWLGTSEDVNRIRNFVFWEDGVRTGTIKDVLDTVHGTHGSQYLEKLLTDIAIGVKGTDNLNPFEKLVGHYKAASVGANLRVVIQQPTAIIRALDMINAHYLAEGAVRPLNGWKKAKKYAPIAQWKDWGHFDINTGRQMKDVLFDNASLLEKTKQAGMWGASKADSISWGLLWNAVEAETKAKHKELEVGTDAYYETVAKRFTEIVDHTQVVDGILQRSQIMRSADNLTKMATSFMGEPTKQYNMAVSAYNDFMTSKGDARKKAVSRLGRTVASLAAAGIINACAQSIIDAMRDDDKEKKYWERWLTAFAGDGEETKWYDTNLADTANPLNYVPFAKDVVSILRGYDVKRMDTEAITKVFDASKNMYKAVTGTGKYTVAEASAQLFAEIARMYGVPVANVKRDVKSLVMATAIETDNYLLQYRLEKAMLDINYAGNSKNYMDILFNAYINDREAYEFIYNDMLGSGYNADKIQSGMETRMKKAEGVEKASELTKRYMTPADEKKYDSNLTRVKSSKVWQSANAEQRKEAEATLYNFLTSDTEDMKKTRTEARAYGVDETEYTLWKLAIEMADQPKGQKGSGSYDYKEKAEAINSLNLGDEEIAYFFGKGLNETSKEELNETLNAGIDVKEYVNFKAAVSEMKSDKNAKGNSIPNSKKRKVVDYLNNAGLTEEEWYYFYYEIMNYKK